VAEQFQLFFVQRFKGKVLFDVPMSQYTSIGVGGPAEVMAFPRDEADLNDLLAFASSKRFPVFILGRGTNLVVRDKGIRGIVINMTEGFNDISWREETSAVVGSGMTLSKLLKQCTERGLSGLEFAEGIPGTVGGAMIMNAGAYGFEMSSLVEGVEVLDRKGKKSFIPKGKIEFGYRTTELPEAAIVTRVHLGFEKKDRADIEETIAAFNERRRASSKVGRPSAGSVFKNPEDCFAGKLIEEAGLKGYTIGGAQVSEVHANYIVNTGHGTARDILGLMAMMRDKVYRLTGKTLEPEIKVVGED
jgi:UDP-N-acetylmuramate dehydrogenase